MLNFTSGSDIVVSPEKAGTKFLLTNRRLTEVVPAMLDREPQLKLEQSRIAQEVMSGQPTLGTLRTRRAQISFPEKDSNELKARNLSC